MSWFSRFKKDVAIDFQSNKDSDDFVLLTWDSCRYDAFIKAKKPNLDPYGVARKATAMATFTMPAHAAMFQGFLPHCFHDEPLYNRYVQQLWRVSHRRVHTKPLVAIPPHTKNIIQGLRNRGYYTSGVGAMYWFRDAKFLKDGFKHFTVTGYNGRLQNEILLNRITKHAKNKPVFGFINYGETHSPFHHADMVERKKEIDSRFSLGRLFNQKGLKSNEWRFDQEAFDMQVSCAEFLDARAGELIAYFKNRGRPTTFVVCADHGECLGEDGLYGHAIYHEKVMEIPLLIFRINAPAHPAPEVIEERVKAAAATTLTQGIV